MLCDIQKRIKYFNYKILLLKQAIFLNQITLLSHLQQQQQNKKKMIHILKNMPYKNLQFIASNAIICAYNVFE